MPDLDPNTYGVLEVAAPPCAADDMGDEVVVLNVETGIYFSVRGLGAALWRDLADGHPVQTLSALAEQEGKGAAVLAFVEQLMNYGIMRASVRAPADSAPAIVAKLKSNDEIVFEAYDDIQDLLLSDPIHDVDPVQGWPKTP
jgi:hypothetical protein